MVNVTRTGMKSWALFQAWAIFSVWLVYLSGHGAPNYSGHSEVTLLGFFYLGPLIFTALQKIVLTFRSPALRVGEDDRKL